MSIAVCVRHSVQIHNSNMTEWSPVRSVIIFVINKIKQQLAGV